MALRFWIGWLRSALLVALALAPAASAAPRLEAYNADIRDSSISGISSGAFMAVQFGIAWSSTIRGVGVVAGGPYYCAQGSAIDGLLGNVGPALTATGPCMKGPPPALEPLIAKADEWARGGEIDDLHNLGHQRIYIFAGYNDTVVNPAVGEAVYRFYRHYAGTAAGNLFLQQAIGAGHSQVTIDYGQPCSTNEGYYIDRCGYDQAGIILRHIYGALNPPNRGTPTGKLLAFDQREMTAPASPASYSMAETGYVYVPTACAGGQPCRVHIALHGCQQNYDAIGDRYIEHAGYNQWADSNRLIILYPQTIAGDPARLEPLNPYGCWDWWGYTNFNYAVKAGRQIAAIKAMLDRLTSRFAPQPRPMTATALDVVVNDVSDAGVALAWNLLPAVSSYEVAREAAGDVAFRSIGSADAPSWGDMGLAPATAYQYKITASRGASGAAPAAQIVTATTRQRPRCGTPGQCPGP